MAEQTFESRDPGSPDDRAGVPERFPLQHLPGVKDYNDLLRLKELCDRRGIEVGNFIVANEIRIDLANGTYPAFALFDLPAMSLPLLPVWLDCVFHPDSYPSRTAELAPELIVEAANAFRRGITLSEVFSNQVAVYNQLMLLPNASVNALEILVASAPNNVVENNQLTVACAILLLPHAPLNEIVPHVVRACWLAQHRQDELPTPFVQIYTAFWSMLGRFSCAGLAQALDASRGNIQMDSKFGAKLAAEHADVSAPGLNDLLERCYHPTSVFQATFAAAYFSRVEPGRLFRLSESLTPGSTTPEPMRLWFPRAELFFSSKESFLRNEAWKNAARMVGRGASLRGIAEPLGEICDREMEKCPQPSELVPNLSFDKKRLYPQLLSPSQVDYEPDAAFDAEIALNELSEGLAGEEGIKVTPGLVQLEFSVQKGLLVRDQRDRDDSISDPVAFMTRYLGLVGSGLIGCAALKCDMAWSYLKDLVPEVDSDRSGLGDILTIQGISEALWQVAMACSEFEGIAEIVVHYDLSPDVIEALAYLPGDDALRDEAVASFKHLALVFREIAGSTGPLEMQEWIETSVAGLAAREIPNIDLIRLVKVWADFDPASAVAAVYEFVSRDPKLYWLGAGLGVTTGSIGGTLIEWLADESLAIRSCAGAAIYHGRSFDADVDKILDGLHGALGGRKRNHEVVGYALLRYGYRRQDLGRVLTLAPYYVDNPKGGREYFERLKEMAATVERMAPKSIFD